MKATTALWLIIVALVAAAVAVFAVSNAHPVPIRFLGWHSAPSLALLVIGAFLCGGVVVAGVSLPGRIRLGLRVRALDRQVAAMTAAASPAADSQAAGGPATAGEHPAGAGAVAPDHGPRQLPASTDGEAGSGAGAVAPPAAELPSAAVPPPAAGAPGSQHPQQQHPQQQQRRP